MRAPIVVSAAAALAVLLSAGAVLAHERGEGEHRRERGQGRPGTPASTAASPGLALYRKECGACHLAYPPGLLPAESWRRTLGGLERHFGQNAELDQGTLAALDRWLAGQAAEAGPSKRSRHAAAAPGGEPPLRISETSWFRREHRGVDGRVLSRPSVRSFANCAACHPGASEWDFDEDRVIIPSR
jgi:mono/diheme cytochrome c family protein